MSRWCWLLLAIAARAAVAAELPEWIRPADADVAKQAFPEDATVQLLYSQDLEVDPSGGREFRLREVFHIREGKAKGHDTAVFVSFSRRRLHDLRAWRRDAGGRTEIFDRPVSSQMLGGKLYAEEREHTVLIPGIGPGAVIGFELAFRDDSPDFRTDSAPARSDVPVQSWEYRLKLPDRWMAEGFWFDPVADTLVAAEPTTTAEGWITWTRERIPAFGEEEPFAPPDPVTSPMFFVRYGRPGDPSMGTWKSVAKWFAGYSASALEDGEQLRPAVEEILGGAKEFDEKVFRIADWVRSSIGYVQIYLADGGFRPHPATEVYANRFGDCKDMAHLAISLLGIAGVRAYPVLTEVTRSGRVQPRFPTQSFDHCIVAIEPPQPEAGLLYFDPTSSTIPLGRLAYPLEGAPALVAGSTFDSSLTYLPARGAAQNGVRVRGAITIAPGLRATVAIEERHLGQRAYAARAMLLALDPGARARWVGKRFDDRFVGAHIDSIGLPDVSRVTDTLTIFYRARIPEIGRTVGDLALIQPDFLTAWGARLFPKDARRRPIHFDYPYRNETVLEVSYPEEWSPEEIPTETAIDNRIASYRRRYEVGRGIARVERIEEVRLTDLPASDYPLLQEWDRTVAGADRQRLVLNLRPR